MLQDSIRNEAYRKAIFDNQDEIKGKVVLDVGTGTGILSVYFAKAGAAKVYAVEASSVYKIAEEVVKENDCQNIIQVIHSRVEDVNLPEQVDIIVSEWMGFYLFHEAMLNSVLYARNKFLKIGGLVFPESATLYSAPCSIPSMFDSWENVNGLRMTAFGKKLRESASKKPITTCIKNEHILSEPEVVTWIDLREVTEEDVRSIKMQHVAVCTKDAKYQGICLWFSVTFPSNFTEPVTLSTGPDDPATHWKQTVVVLPTEFVVEKEAPIAYALSLTRSESYNRTYSLEVEMLDAETIEHPQYCLCYLTKCILTRAVLEKYEQDSLAR